MLTRTTRVPQAAPLARRPWAALLLWLWLVPVAACASFDGGGASDADSGQTASDVGASADTTAGGGDSAVSGDSVASGGDAGGSAADVAPDVAGPESQRIRVVAANLSSGKKQSYDPGHGARILRGLKPDIVLIQEFNVGDNSPASVNAFVVDTFTKDFGYYREVGPSNTMIPNGIISRFPIVDSGSWDDALVKNREFAWARIDVPGPKDLWAVSLHLLTSKSSVRAKEIQQLVTYIKANVPEGDLLVVGGDLNTNSVSEQSLNSFGALLNRTHRPKDQSGNGHTNAPRNKPYDRLFADQDLEAFHVPVQIGAQSFADGLVFDSRVFTPLTDVSPVQKDDSAAEAMQHMAVVRDFALPVQ